MHHSTDRIAHTTAFVTPVVEHWLEREIAVSGRVLLVSCFLVKHSLTLTLLLTKCVEHVIK